MHLTCTETPVRAEWDTGIPWGHRPSRGCPSEAGHASGSSPPPSVTGCGHEQQPVEVKVFNRAPICSLLNGDNV